MPSSEVIKAIAVTAELCGRTFSPEAAMVFAGDLEGFPDHAVIAALGRVRKEVKTFLTVSDVISRIDDGRPGAEQAWAMIPQDEQTSVVWSEEMAAAFGIAAPLLQMGDKIGARMAFKEAYAKLLATARDNRLPAKWSPSFGDDKSGRQLAVTEAARHGRIGIDHAVSLLPVDEAKGLLLTLKVKDHPLLAPPDKQKQAQVRAMLSGLKQTLLIGGPT